MVSKYRIYPYKMGSRSAKVLSRSLNGLRVYPDGNFTHKSRHVVINWGNSTLPDWYRLGYKIYNHPFYVKQACNKLTTLQILQDAEVSVPQFTTVISEAREFDGVVVCRTSLTGHSGYGIVLAESPDDIVQAPLYTKHVRHKHEYRVHVFDGEVIDYTQKKRRRDTEVNPYVRNLAGNWVFCRDGVELPDEVRDQCINAVEALGLDFGAVDVGYRESDDKAFIFEVNTSPGLEGTTLLKYVEAFKCL